MIKVSEENFCIHSEYEALIKDNSEDGAVVFFVGLVRDFNQGEKVSSLFLEHYPAMTLKSLSDIVELAQIKWSLGRVRLVHRVGQLAVNEQIVFVGVSAQHRADAFSAAEFIMDKLKTQAPFWKKEQTSLGDKWVSQNQSDRERCARWNVYDEKGG